MTQPKNLIEALLEARKVCTAPYKDKVNPHHKSRYASLFAILEAVEDACDDHALFIETNWFREAGQWVGIESIVTFVPTGETKRTYCPVGDVDKMTSQQVGSAWTYARRYTILALFNLAPTDEKPQTLDDDGEALQNRAPKKEAPTPPPAPKNSISTIDQWKEINTQRKKKVYDFIQMWRPSYPQDIEEFASAYVSYKDEICTGSTLHFFKSDQWTDLDAGMQKFERDHT